MVSTYGASGDSVFVFPEGTFVRGPGGEPVEAGTNAGGRMMSVSAVPLRTREATEADVT